MWSRLELVLLRAGGAYANALRARLIPPRHQLTHSMQVLGKLGPICCFPGKLGPSFSGANWPTHLM